MCLKTIGFLHVWEHIIWMFDKFSISSSNHSHEVLTDTANKIFNDNCKRAQFEPKSRKHLTCYVLELIIENIVFKPDPRGAKLFSSPWVPALPNSQLQIQGPLNAAVTENASAVGSLLT